MMISEKRIVSMDIKDIAIIGMLCAAHKLMTGRGIIALLRETARCVVKDILLRYVKAKSSINEGLRSVDLLLSQPGPLKSATSIVSKITDNTLIIEVHDCAFTNICSLITDVIEANPQIVEILRARPCAIGILYSAFMEQVYGRTFDLSNVEHGKTCRIELREFKI